MGYDGMRQAAEDRADAHRDHIEQLKQAKVGEALKEKGYHDGPGHFDDRTGSPSLGEGKTPPWWISVLLWAGLIWAFLHVPSMTHGVWSGPLGFGAIIAVGATTIPRFRGFAFGCLLPFAILGTLAVLFISVRHHDVSQYPHSGYSAHTAHHHTAHHSRK